MSIAAPTEPDAPAPSPLPLIGPLVTSIRALPVNLRGALWLILATTVFTLVGVFIRKATHGLDSIEPGVDVHPWHLVGH